jgi:hypothetical protein
MRVRVALLVIACALCAGCASPAPISGTFAAQAATTTSAPEAERDPRKKTLAGQVLAAIAIERVTGRKPATQQYYELN